MRMAAVLALGAWAATGPAAASDLPRADLFGGYSYSRSEDQGLHGWSAAFGYNFTRHLEAEVELGAHYGGFDNGTDFSRLSLLAGPRLNFRAGGVTPFLRALAGAVRSSAGITVQGVDISARDTAFGAAAGGGVDLPIGRRWGLRLQGDYFMIDTEGEMAGHLRAGIGVSCRLGRLGATESAPK